MDHTDIQDFEQFMKQREEAASAYICGDATLFSRLVARAGDATFFAPRGGEVHGAEAVFTTYEHDAISFAPGGEGHFEVIQMGASNGSPTGSVFSAPPPTCAGKQKLFHLIYA